VLNIENQDCLRIEDAFPLNDEPYAIRSTPFPLKHDFAPLKGLKVLSLGQSLEGGAVAPFQEEDGAVSV
jgi:hypothetical protein